MKRNSSHSDLELDEPLCKKQKVSFNPIYSITHSPIIKYNENGSELQRPQTTLFTDLSNIQSRNLNNFKKDLMQPVRMLEDSLIEMEKLKTVTKEFNKNYQLHTFQKKGKSKISELFGLKNRIVSDGLVRIFEKGKMELIERMKLQKMKLAILTGLQEKWNIKKMNDVSSTLFIDLSVSKMVSKCYRIYLVDNEKDFDFICDPYFVYGKESLSLRDYINRNGVDLNYLFQLAQNSIINLEIFKFFCDVTKKYIISSKSYEFVLGITGDKYVKIALEKDKEIGKFYVINIYQNIAKDFSRTLLYLLKRAFFMVIKETHYRPVLFDRSLQASFNLKPFDNVLRFINHYYVSEKFMILCKKFGEEFPIVCSKFEYPHKTEFDIEGIKFFVIGTKLKFRKESYDDLTMDNIRFLIERERKKRREAAANLKRKKY